MPEVQGVVRTMRETLTLATLAILSVLLEEYPVIEEVLETFFQGGEK